MAAAVGVSRNAVQRWLRWYREGGLDAVRDWLEAQLGVIYTVGSLYTLLPRLGIRLKTPRPRHTQAAPPRDQEAWKKGSSAHG